VFRLAPAAGCRVLSRLDSALPWRLRSCSALADRAWIDEPRCVRASTRLYSQPMSLIARRLVRIGRRRSVRWAAHAVRRELRLVRDEVALDRSLRSDRSLIIGPFLGEVGYELLYWRPLILRLLRSRRVDPSRVVVVTRGGAGAWYREVAAAEVDVLDLIPADMFHREVEQRVERTGQRKQMHEDGLDRQIIELVRERVGEADVIHPRLMYGRLRFLWEGLRPPGDALLLGDYDPVPRMPLAPQIEARLPERFVALKVYFNDCLPDRQDVHRQLRGVVERLELPVVALQAGAAVDDHVDWTVSGSVIRVADLFEPRSNLAVQAELVGRAQALVSTYGGFSYVGPFVGTPTTALWVEREKNKQHELVLRTVKPSARYERLRLSVEHVAST
jgi:hypothetical protein